VSEEENKNNDIASLRVELLETLDRKVNEEFDRAKELLSLTIGTGLKVTGGAVVILMLVITILGVKTASDISGSIESFTESEIKNKLENYSPTAKYQAKVNDLYNQALIDAYLLKIERYKNDRFYRGKVTSGDVETLLSILQNQKSTLKQFSDSALILRKFSDSTSWNSIAGEFARLIEASEGNIIFMASQADKKEALIKQLSEKQYEAGKKLIKSIALDSGQSDEMRLTAIRYLADLGDYSSIPDLEALSESAIPDINKEALKALTRINPRNQKLISWEKNYFNTSSDKLEEIHLGFSMIEKLLEGNPKHRHFFGVEDPDEEYRLNFSKKILVKVFSTNMGFFSNTHGFDDDRSLSIAIGDDPNTYYFVDHKLLFGRQFNAIRSLMAEYAESNNIEALAKIVKKITVRDGKKIVAVVRVELNEDSRLITTDGLVLDSDNTQLGIGLYHLENQDGKDSIEAIWLDSTSSRMRRQISSVEGGNNLTFNLKTDVKFDE